MWVVMVEHRVNGLSLYGPFDTEWEASRAAEYLSTPWYVVELKSAEYL